jgi:hypothetical protein
MPELSRIVSERTERSRTFRYNRDVNPPVLPNNVKEFQWPFCPLCGGRMVRTDVSFLMVSVCDDCETAVTVPTSAWDVARAKQHLKPRQSPQ